MRIFKEVTLPTTCYVPEAALWVSLGRPPEYFTDNEGNELRESEYEELAPYDEYGFSEREFAMAGAKIDMDRYLKARMSSAWDDDIRLLVQQLITNDENRNVHNQLIKEAESEAAEADWARAMEEQMVPLVDRGRAIVFQALASGSLLAKGWREQPSHRLNDTDDLDGQFISIDPKQWSLRGFDWENSDLTTAAGQFSKVSVTVEDMLRVLGTPSGEGAPIDGLMYSETIILQEDAPPISLKRVRGRPPKSVGDIRTVVMNVFEERKRRGVLPEKTEAILAEVIDFVQTAFKQSIVRSTAQSYIAGINLNTAENLPENAAG